MPSIKDHEASMKGCVGVLVVVEGFRGLGFRLAQGWNRDLCFLSRACGSWALGFGFVVLNGLKKCS